MQGIRVIDNVVEVELETNTAAHADGDVVCQCTELAGVALPNGCAVIQTIVLTDYDDQGDVLDCLFFSRPVTVGANNAAMTISDSDMRYFLGHQGISSADYIDLPNNQAATVKNVGLELKPEPSTPESVWVTVMANGSTPTYAGGRLTLRVGVLRG